MEEANAVGRGRCAAGEVRNAPPGKKEEGGEEVTPKKRGIVSLGWRCNEREVFLRRRYSQHGVYMHLCTI